ncbi:MAG: anhydro-N-acetylmuramic acid kinase [Acetobacteraceae bacterium]
MAGKHPRPPARCPASGAHHHGGSLRAGRAGGRAFAAAAAQAPEADLVASHGQTVFHWVESGQARGSLQLGQPAAIVEATGLPVISDFRARMSLPAAKARRWPAHWTRSGSPATPRARR